MTPKLCYHSQKEFSSSDYYISYLKSAIIDYFVSESSPAFVIHDEGSAHYYRVFSKDGITAIVHTIERPNKSSSLGVIMQSDITKTDGLEEVISGLAMKHMKNK